MGLISENLLSRRPQELGKIKIGGVGREKQSAGGNTFRLPVKYDHFVVTTRHRGPDGNFVKDAEIHEAVGENPVVLEGVLMFETPEQNLHAEMVQYVGRKQVISCDGEEFENHRDGTCGPCPRANGGECPKLGKPPQCKPYGRLHIQLRDAPNTFGFHVFRTTSWESVSNIQSTLKEIYERFGTLYQAPVRLVLYPSEDNHDSGTSTSYKVGLVLAMAIEEAAERMVRADRVLKSARAQLRLVAGEVQEELRARDDEERRELAEEFFPQDVEATRASIATESRFQELRDELGVGGDAPPAVDADYEIVEDDEPDPPPEAENPTVAQAVDVLRDLIAEAQGLGALGDAGRAAAEAAIESDDMPGINRWVDELNARIEERRAESTGTEG